MTLITATAATDKILARVIVPKLYRNSMRTE